MIVPIIAYHAIGDCGSVLWTPPRRFRAQLSELRQAGYQSVSLGALADWLNGAASLPDRPVVISFDDGYASVYAEARSLMDHFGFRGTVFVISDRCGADNHWPGQAPDVPIERLLNWVEIGELAADGWEIGAHTCTHPVLPHLSAALADAEMERSQTAIATATGRQVNVFAYPYGAVDQRVRAGAARHFGLAVGTRLGFATPRSDRWCLPRIDAHYLHPRLITRMHSPLFARYLAARQLARDLRRHFRPDWAAA